MFFSKRRLKPADVENARIDGDLSSDMNGATGKIYRMENVVLIWDDDNDYTVFEKR